MSVIHVIWSISWALSNFNNSIDMLGLSYIHCITTLFLSSGWFIMMSAIFYRCTHAITWTRNIYFPDINQFCIKLYYALYKLWPFQLCEFKIILTKFRNIRNLQPVSNYNFVNSKYTFMVKKAVSWNIKKIWMFIFVALVTYHPVLRFHVEIFLGISTLVCYCLVTVLLTILYNTNLNMLKQYVS